MKHVSAEDVLPSELIEQLRKYCTGYIYVPGAARAGQRRRERVFELSGMGLTTAQIAEEVGLCKRRIRQILAEKRE